MKAPWSLKMAWRDSRGSRRRLLLFMSAMVLGVAALVAVHGFGANLRSAVEEQARSLLGADLSFESRQPFSKDTEALIDSIGGEQARRVSFSSMAFFPKTGDTRLAMVRGLEGDYPFYGDVVAVPREAARTYLNGQQALIDAGLMKQFDVVVGDSVRIGRTMYEVAGALEKTPRESAAVMLFSPRIYIPLAHLDRSLLSQGSRAEYEVYFKFKADRDVEALVETIRPHLRKHRIGFDTVEEATSDWSEGLENLNRFLSLVAFLALLMGGLGVASAVHVYVKRRLDTVAVLRCLGATSGRTFRVYLVQAAVMGLVCAILGGAIGLIVQAVLPVVLADFLPVAVPFAVAWMPLLLGLGVGLGVTLLFALLPLVSVRNVSPLHALRVAYEPAVWTDRVRWALLALLAGVIVVAAVLQAPNWQTGVGYATGVLVVFGLLALVARALMALTRRFFPASWAYPWRQGLANLFRPQNQTVMLTLALGFGTFLILTLYLVQRTLLAQVVLSDQAGQPNMVLFDIQPEQLAGVTELVQEEQLPVLDRVPIVTMRLAAVKGRPIAELRTDSTTDVSWAHTREYRSTYRDYLTGTEEILEGALVDSVARGTDPVPVSVEQGIMDELGVALGDTLAFDVQGLSVKTVIASKRKVDWRRVSTNFFVVFPKGVLERAPQSFVVLTRTEADTEAAALQNALVQRFPNVSVIDISLVLGVIDALFSRIAFVIRFMALFSILTGLVVLAGAVVVSRVQRIEESVLLKTLGASRRQVVKIMLIEYFFLGLLAAVAGVLMAVAAAWALAAFVFEVPFVMEPLPLVLAVLIVTGLTVGIGVLNSRGIYDRPALEVLRAPG